MKHIVFLLVFLCGLYPLAGRSLFDSGRSDYVIVVAPDAVPAELTAATQLQYFLREISGVELPIVETSRGPAIRVGQSPSTAQMLGIADWNNLQPDEVRLKTVGDDLYVVGERPRGTLYAVYELLEKEFGVRFWTASVTQIPKKSTFELPRSDFRYAPPFEVRAAGYELLRWDPRFAARTRNNGHGVKHSPEWGGSIQLIGGVHTFLSLIPPAAFQTHPEWFSERNGKRSPHAQLCLTNPELRRELTRRTLEQLRSRPAARYISVSQNDNMSFCQCSSCNAFVKRHGNQSDLLIDAVNEVAAAVKEEFPDILVETLAYNYTREAPVKIAALDNVIIRYCTIEAKSFQPLESETNRKLKDDLENWRHMAKSFMIWNYTTNFRKYYLPHPNWHTLAPDLRFFRKNGAISIYEQGSWNGGGSIADLPELRAWFISKLLWNPDLDAQSLMDEFIAGYYGPAADAIRSYIREMTRAASRHPECRNGCYASSTSAWLESETLVKAWQNMESAYQRFKDDPIYGSRISTAGIPIACALLERRELWPESRSRRLPELRDVEFLQYLAAIEVRMKNAKADRIREGNQTPEKWAQEVRATNSLLPNDGKRPVVAGTDAYYAWSIQKVAELHALGRELFWETDPAASVGKAVRMPNTHNQWHIQAFSFPCGTFDLYADVRCDSDEPTGNAIRIGTYDWSNRKELHQDFAASDIAGKAYRTVKVGTLKLNSDTCIFVAPIENPKVGNIWIDRIILLPVK